ncbi:LAGLIDADG family homing endonuclease, partial [Methanoregula sp.]|uniref:LAGLIDADG family homing endonuclease n=1 Tax=Methanoregula sp. TaxID=2052170 RepID=UPI0035671905
TVYALETDDGFPIECTDTFLPFYTKDATGRNQNALDDENLGSRKERWMIGVSTMSGCPVGCKFCLLPTSVIQMANFSYKYICDVTVGDIVISNQLTKASNEKSEYASLYSKASIVTGIMKRHYSGKIIHVITKSGKIVTGTPEHPIAIKRLKYRKKFIPISSVRVGDMAISCNEIHTRTEGWYLGWVVGFVDGDGVYTKNTGNASFKTSVSQSEETTLALCRKLLNKYGVVTTKVWDNGHNNGRFSFGKKSKEVLDSLVEKCESTKDFARGYVAGFWDAEGFSLRNNKSYRVCNTNINLLGRVSKYLLLFDVKSEIKLYESNKSDGVVKDCFVLESELSNKDFCATFRPVHPKAIYLNCKRSKSFSSLDVVVDVSEEYYDGDVYNIETDEKTYFANDILVHNCATGKLPRWRKLTAAEIVEQVEFILSQHSDLSFCEAQEHKINYTRMGEPFLNLPYVQEAIRLIEEKYPGTHHYVSTIGMQGSDFSWIKDNITLQVSLHSLDEARRDALIPVTKKMTIQELGQIRTESKLKTTVNMTLVDEDDFDIEKLMANFDPAKFFIKVSPINPNEISKGNNLGPGVIRGVNLV